jgi:hypothetical protein
VEIYFLKSATFALEPRLWETASLPCANNEQCHAANDASLVTTTRKASLLCGLPDGEVATQKEWGGLSRLR